MFVFGKVLDQLIRATLLKINPIILSFNSLTATLLHSSFVRKNIFYSENIQYVYSFYGTNLYVDVCRAAFRTQSNIYSGTFLQKFQKSFIVDILLGSKYASAVSFTVEKVCRVSLFFQYS